MPTCIESFILILTLILPGRPLAAIAPSPPISAFHYPDSCWNMKDLDRPSVSNLKLMLRANHDVYGTKEGVELEVKIVNEGLAPWTIFPGFTPEHHTPIGYPTSELTFVVTDESGKRIPYAGFYEELSEPTSVHAFEPIECGSFIGRFVSLTRGEFSYGLKRPGVYHIRAQLRHSARQWVLARLKATGMKVTDIIYSIESIFEGTLVSDTVTIKIAPHE